MATRNESKWSNGGLGHRVPSLGPCHYPFLLSVCGANVVLAVPRLGQRDRSFITRPYNLLNTTALLSLSRHPWVLRWSCVDLSKYIP